MEQEDGRRPHYHKGHEGIRGQLAYRRSTPEEQGKEHQDDSAADKAKLLPQYAENEVRMFFRQERQVGLGTVTEPLPGYAAAANGSNGLEHLVAIAHRVAHGVQKGVHPLLLVRFQHIPDHGACVARQDVCSKENSRQNLGKAAADQRKHHRANQDSPQTGNGTKAQKPRGLQSKIRPSA